MTMLKLSRPEFLDLIDRYQLDPDLKTGAIMLAWYGRYLQNSSELADSEICVQ